MRGLRRAAAAVLLLVLPAVLLAAGAELVLAALGLGDPLGRAPLSRGFDPRAAYLVPEASGGWRTQMFGAERKRFEQLVPPKGAGPRVVLFGGSNTQQLPDALLEDALAARRPGLDWDVVNLGRAGYGSERVSILFRQAFVLEPDLVVVYAGHNEFIERGFREELEGEGGADVPGWLADTRLFTLLAQAAAREPEPPRAGAPPPEPVDRHGRMFADLTYDETLRFYDAYRRNLELMARVAAERDVPMILGTVVANDVQPPTVGTPPAGLREEARARVASWRQEARALVPPRFLTALDPPVRLSSSRWKGAGLGGPLAASAIDKDGGWPPRLRPLSGFLAPAPATAGDQEPSVEGAHWPPPSAWSPEVDLVLDHYARLVAPDTTPAEREDLARARALLERALAVADGHPGLHHDHALVCWLLGDARGAARGFERAGALDRAPRRGNAVSNAIVREVAGAHPHVTLFDADARVRASCPAGIIGYEVMMDACHMHPGVRAALMEELADVIVSVREGR